MEKNREKAWDICYVTDRKWWTRLVQTESTISSLWHSNVPRPSPNLSPRLRDKIWEWPEDEATLSSNCWPYLFWQEQIWLAGRLQCSAVASDLTSVCFDRNISGALNQFSLPVTSPFCSLPLNWNHMRVISAPAPISIELAKNSKIFHYRLIMIHYVKWHETQLTVTLLTNDIQRAVAHCGTRLSPGFRELWLTVVQDQGLASESCDSLWYNIGACLSMSRELWFSGCSCMYFTTKCNYQCIVPLVHTAAKDHLW